MKQSAILDLRRRFNESALSPFFIVPGGFQFVDFLNFEVNGFEYWSAIFIVVELSFDFVVGSFWFRGGVSADGAFPVELVGERADCELPLFASIALDFFGLLNVAAFHHPLSGLGYLAHAVND